MLTSQANYTLLIPHYQDYDNLVLLLKDIHDSNHKHQPQKIIIVDDSSYDDRVRFIHKQYASSQLPPIELRVINHQGPFYAESYGLDKITTDYAIICHSDTRLLGNVKSVLPDGVKFFDDVLSVLYHYITESKDAVAVACPTVWEGDWTHVQFTDPNKILDPIRIIGGIRGMATEGIPYSVYRDLQIGPIKSVTLDDWQRVCSIDNSIYALDLNKYREVGGFDKLFAPYGYYHDDFFGRCRMKGYHTYSTQDTIAYHPHGRDKPKGSLATYDGDRFLADIKAFKDRWNQHAVWQSDALRDGNEQILSIQAAKTAGLI